MAYAFVLTTLDGAEVSDLPLADARKVTFSSVGMSSASLTYPLDDAPDGGASDGAADLIASCDSMLKVLELDRPGTSAPVLVFHGRQTDFDEQGAEAGETIAGKWSDASWNLAHRLVGKTAAGYNRGTALAPVQRTTILTELLAALNAESPTGLVAGTIQPSGVTAVTGWYYKPALEALVDLTTGADAPEWRVRPTELTAAGAFGSLDLGPALSVPRPDAVFEYGDGFSNVPSYQHVGTLEGTANRAFSLPPDNAENASQAVLKEENPDSIARRGLFEAAVSSELTVDELRRQLVAHHVLVRGGVRHTIQFAPARGPGGYTDPRLGLDFNAGDVVSFRASIDRAGRKVKRTDALMRVYVADLDLDREGGATLTLTLAPDASTVQAVT